MNTQTTQAIVYTDGSQQENKDAGAASIILYNSKRFKFLSYLGKVESSQAELWAFILSLVAVRIINPKVEKIHWISDSKSSQSALFSKKNNKHSLEWDLINVLIENREITCEFINRNIKNRNLNQCDKASRWAATKKDKNMGPCSLFRKNTKAGSQWFDVNLFKNNKLTSEIESIDSNLRVCID